MDLGYGVCVVFRLSGVRSAYSLWLRSRKVVAFADAERLLSDCIVHAMLGGLKWAFLILLNFAIFEGFDLELLISIEVNFSRSSLVRTSLINVSNFPHIDH